MASGSFQTISEKSEGGMLRLKPNLVRIAVLLDTQARTSPFMTYSTTGVTPRSYNYARWRVAMHSNVRAYNAFPAGP